MIGESVVAFVRIRANLAVAASMLVLLALILASPGGAFGIDGNAARLAKVILIVLVAFVWMNIPCLLGYAIVGRLLGAHVRRISIGVGAYAVCLDAGRLKITLTPFVFGGFVEFCKHGKGLRDLPALSQMLVALSGPIAAVAVNALILREETIGAATRTWPQLYAIVTDYSRSWDAIPSFLSAERERGLTFVVALVATKAAAVSLLPIPLFAGGNALVNLFEAARGRLLSEETLHRIYSAGLVVWLGLAFVICGRFAYEAYKYAAG